jgi:Raf kinase inhibitor-like YbhB/YbcL family protein
MGNLKLTSSDFEDGGVIPRKCGYKNGNEEPALAVTGISEETESLVLIMDDPDAMGAVGKVWLHWLLWDIIPNAENYMGYNIKSRTLPDTDHFIGLNDFGELGYGGPAPPDKRHTYVFKVYALDCTLNLEEKTPEEVTKVYIEKAMEGHILDQATLTGTYAP